MNKPQGTWTKETPKEWGLYWVLQEGYKQELANAGHPPIVLLMHFPRNGELEEYWGVRLLAGCFFHHHGSMSSIWAKDPTLEWMLDHYDIKGWQKLEPPALPEEGGETQ